MTTFNMQFNCDGAAFPDEGMASEVARILSKAATQVRLGYELAPITDFNGDTIGDWSIA